MKYGGKHENGKRRNFVVSGL